MNRLSGEKSAYLQHAARQPIDWYPWSDEPFERARKENKPVFLSSGAVWCHWCHVMAKESFEDEEVAQLLNRYFIAVKLDRDERPDVDRRYQRAVAAMGMGGGWPLSVFLTPERRPFYGGTYFPPLDSYGRPGFKPLLIAIAEAYRDKREEIEESAGRIIDFLKDLKKTPGDPGPPSPDGVDQALEAVLAQVDERNGGFGSAPKFPMPGALEFLLNRYFKTREERIAGVLRRTLTSMAKGGIHDHLGGGFHRYSTDDWWIIPHFEKMTDDNAWLLRNYAFGYALFGEPLFREVAEGIGRFMVGELSDPEGGFYGSQDADVTPEDEGGYFIWTDRELKGVLTEEEYRLAKAYYFHEKAAMRHDPAKRVLYTPKTLEGAAREAGIAPGAAPGLIASAKEKLLARRETREKPVIDRAIYTNLNGMTIAAFFDAYRVLGDETLRDAALKGLKRVLEVNVEGGELMHVPGVKALLDDYVYLGAALAAAYEVTGEKSFLERARGLMDTCLARFWDREGAGFFDTDEEVVEMRIKGNEDTPHPSANSGAIILLLKLSAMTGEERYLRYAEASLRLFSADASMMGLHAGYFHAAMDRYLNPLKLEIRARPGSILAGAALSAFHPWAAITWGEDEGRIVPCAGTTCYEPLTDGDALGRFLGTRPTG